MSIVHKLTKLQYSDDRKGSLRLYRFNPNGYHSGGQWFAKHIRYPDEEISIQDAKALADRHMARNLEVRITNGGDELVFHAKGEEVIYPKEGATEFWESLR